MRKRKGWTGIVNNLFKSDFKFSKINDCNNSRRRTMEYPKFKAASVLASPVFLDREATVSKVCDLIKEASQQGAELIALPETFIPCYPWWGFMGIKHLKKQELFKKLLNNSVAIPSKATDTICRAAKQYNIMVVIGINELDVSSRDRKSVV
jgi:predicted amidohydrolase